VVKVGTSAEIIAKKFWHRGDRANARDLFDLCAVADAQPDQIAKASPFMVKHGYACLTALAKRAPVVKREFEAIGVIKRGTFKERMRQAESIIGPLLPQSLEDRYWRSGKHLNI